MTKQELELREKELSTELRRIKSKLYDFDFEEKKEQYGDKFTCEFCKFRAVADLSGDGWHNTCGADNCTCCHNVCDKYEPDNEITLFIKRNIRADSGLLRCEKTNGYGYIRDDEYRALEELAGDIFRHTDKAEKIIKVLSVCFDIDERTKEHGSEYERN